jgi:hypothetical protein
MGTNHIGSTLDVQALAERGEVVEAAPVERPVMVIGAGSPSGKTHPSRASTAATLGAAAALGGGMSWPGVRLPRGRSLTPNTEADDRRIARAEAKRARRAERNRKLAGAK